MRLGTLTGRRVASAAVSLLVQKFGGTSVADPERMRSVAENVARCRRRGDHVVLGVSARRKETDELLRLAPHGYDIPLHQDVDTQVSYHGNVELHFRNLGHGFPREG